MLQSTGPMLAELREVDAPAPIRAIYAELRRLSAVPMVALIFRHLATHPGVIEDVWQALRPLIESGHLQETAWRVAREMAPRHQLPRVEPHARAAIGLEGDALEALSATLAAYNRANPVNLLSMLTILARLRSRAPSEPPAAREWSPPPAILHPLPPMVPPDAMRPEIRRLINDLGFGDRSTLDPVVPSLYRHLTEWPGYLAILHVVLVPRFRDGTLAHAVATLQGAMASEAERLAIHLPPLPALARVPDAISCIDRFAASVIPQMIVVGIALSDALE